MHLIMCVGSSYGIAVLNGTSDQCDVLVTDQQLTNHGTMAWQRNFQESNVHLNYAKVNTGQCMGRMAEHGAVRG